ncbi:MAG: hypothetical protein SWH54_00360 [Thermodesulfobacteriota bacterium]|nr:hypothetical protein [Thermodesulfobacteriota bacterium]
MLRLSQHFCENWKKRVGIYPTIEAVHKILKEGVRIQMGRELKHPDGTPFRMLAIYWHPDLDIVVKIDRVKNMAVTVLTRENFNGNQR